METAGDHQVEDQPEVAVQAEGDALADAADCADGFAFGSGDGRDGGAQQEWAIDADLLQCLVENARLEGGDVGGDVGQFRHAYEVRGWGGNLQVVLAVARGGERDDLEW